MKEWMEKSEDALFAALLKAAAEGDGAQAEHFAKALKELSLV